MNSPREYRGDEAVFEPIRSFILNGGDKDRFFVANAKFRSPFVQMQDGSTFVSLDWCHLLAGEEIRTLATVSVSLFVGPDFIPKTHEVRIAELDSRLLMLRSNFGHTYRYFREGESAGWAGAVTSTPPHRIRG
jgi:hypothetical protein